MDSRGRLSIRGRSTREAWFVELFRATSFLACGSALLLLGWAYLLWGGALFLPLGFAGLTLVAITLHAWSWRSLFETLFTTRTPLPPWEEWVMRAAFVVSVAAFVLGLAAVLLPSNSRPYMLGYVLFPYLPAVYGVVVVCHAMIFLVAARGLPERSAVRAAVGGALGLLGIAAAGFAVPFLLLDGPTSLKSLTWPFPGLTALGYGVAAWAWAQG